MRRANLVGTLAFALGSLGALPIVSGCRVSETDVHRWEQTERGPFKLVAVVEHDKYAWPLRVEAALSLVRMPPRGGVRQGIRLLTDHFTDDEGVDRPGALVGLPEDARRHIVNGMAPALIQQMQAPPPAPSR